LEGFLGWGWAHNKPSIYYATHKIVHCTHPCTWHRTTTSSHSLISFLLCLSNIRFWMDPPVELELLLPFGFHCFNEHVLVITSLHYY
jgi:hypothetical protein